MPKTYYVVRGGRNIGIFTNRQTALLIAENKPERLQEYNNYHLALRQLQKMTENAIFYSLKPNGNYIHLDVSVNRATGFGEFRVMQGKKTVLETKNIEFCTPNLIEYLALVEAFKYVKYHKISEKIYCDNLTAINSFRNKWTVSIPPSIRASNIKLTQQIEKACAYVKELEENELKCVEFWDKSMWGEIPSDYGRKKK